MAREVQGRNQPSGAEQLYAPSRAFVVLAQQAKAHIIECILLFQLVAAIMLRKETNLQTTCLHRATENFQLAVDAVKAHCVNGTHFHYLELQIRKEFCSVGCSCRSAVDVQPCFCAHPSRASALCNLIIDFHQLASQDRAKLCGSGDFATSQPQLSTPTAAPTAACARVCVPSKLSAIHTAAA